MAAGLLVCLVGAVALLRVAAAPPALPAVVPVLGRTALWLPLVRRGAGAYGLPEALELGLIAHESHGDYAAVDPDPNGTIDAGLTQINSGPPPSYPHWAEYGLSANPDDPARNVAASLRILSADVRQYGDVTDALLAYNAGTPAAGRRWDPAYPQDVLGYARQMEAGPVVAAWPAGPGWTAGAAGWERAPGEAGDPVYVVVAAMAPEGPAVAYGGASWTGLQVPDAVFVRAAGATYGARPSLLAPPGLRAAMPPSASYRWAALALPEGRPVRVTVTALWYVGGTRPHTLRAGTALALSAAGPARGSAP